MNGQLYTTDLVLFEESFLSLLSPREYEKYLKYRHRDRQGKWLRGRLLAKYAFLENPGSNDLGKGDHQLSLTNIDCNQLYSYSDWMYRSVEVLSVSHPQNGPLQYRHNGNVEGKSLSISHSDPFSFVYLSGERYIGVDAQAVFTSQQPSFYRNYFTAAEQNWVHFWSSSISPELLFTFLWTIKEAVFKASRNDQHSLWHLAKIEVDVEGLDMSSYAWEKALTCDVGGEVDIIVRNEKSERSYRAYITRMKNNIITIVYQKELSWNSDLKIAG